MKHLPNLLTLTNLFCGCIAIAFILNSQPFLANFNSGEQYWVIGTEQMWWGSVFIGIAALCDLLDGFAARALRVYSPIGKDLDSLADVVSFGVAPSMILFKMLWGAWMRQPNAMDVDMLAMAPAFLVACFAALRLAKFNVSVTDQQHSFRGLPVPAVGIFVASLPLVNWYDTMHLGEKLQGRWTIYLLIIILCWLMVSNIRFFKLMPHKWTMRYVWPQLILVIVTLAAIPLIQVAAVPLAFIVYVLLSLVYKEPQTVIINS
ncbi:MAG: CDP-alcohol phosphatidyltransferase family protein [Taibaiella sp.]|nr:CDP-alcohol phosphatidyltransferase family protein [Taibaiella sp.]